MWFADEGVRAVAICRPENASAMEGGGALALEGVSVACGIVRTTTRLALPPGHVLLRVRAFSCNYRDKALILGMALRGRPGRFLAVGSEFVADVVDVGAGVTTCARGDRVIGNGSYPVADVAGANPGLPTNHASREQQVLHAAKVMRIPPGMSDATAASFALGAQTAYSMVRRLALEPGAHVLVTGARSNTGLFALAALKRQHAIVYALTSAPGWEMQLRQAGADEVLTVTDRDMPLAENPAIAAVLRTRGGFDAAIDPFADVYLARVVRVLAAGGRYVTCGIHDQFRRLLGRPSNPAAWDAGVLTTIIMKNLSILGNCIGRTGDLERALEDHRAGWLVPTVDSVYSGANVQPFFERTFNAADRFGKVVYAYA